MSAQTAKVRRLPWAFGDKVAIAMRDGPRVCTFERIVYPYKGAGIEKILVRDPVLNRDRSVHLSKVYRTCGKCGCTDEHGCDQGCYWVAETLCSACAKSKAGRS